jgi:beta-glucosidase
MPAATIIRVLLLGLVLIVTACERRAEAPPPSAESDTGVQSEPAAGTAEAPRIDPESWPQQSPPLPRNPEHEQRIADLLTRMSLEEKVGQVLQADIATVTPQDVRDYHLGLC